MKTNSERRNFFKKAGISAVGAALLSAVPLNLFAKANTAATEKNTAVTITINPMAVKREKRK